MKKKNGVVHAEEVSYREVQLRQGNAAARMSAALISLAVVTLSTLVLAEGPPLSMVGEGFMSRPPPGGKGVRYAGPIVYSNEKPPIIYFPPPPKDAKPGIGGPYYGKSKSPKAIKYVPMPHHDLPVLIYTSDKVPPIHVVQPPPGSEGGGGGPPQSSSFPSSFGLQKDEFFPSSSFHSGDSGFRPGPPPPSAYGHHQEVSSSSSARIVSSSYKIPPTSYGSPVTPYGSPLGSLDLSSGSSSSVVDAGTSSSIQHSVVSGGQHQQPPVPGGEKPIFGTLMTSSSAKGLPPHILYQGHPPIHVFNEPDMFVKAPREIPLKSFDDMPPKASFGPPKNSFGPPTINTFSSPVSYNYRPVASFGPPSHPPYRPPHFAYNIIPARENPIQPSFFRNPSPSYAFGAPAPLFGSHHQTQKAEGSESSPVVSSPHGFSSSSSSSSSSYGPPTYSFSPPQSSSPYSMGPFSIEYGPPTEPLVSYSEPTGSLTSLYGAMSGGNGGGDEGWMPGPPPASNGPRPIKEDAWSPPPQSLSHHNRPSPAVHFPSGPFGGGPSSKLAHLFSSFKMKRSKPKYAVAPKSMHKPPIIIYYGKKPPMHVYQKPDEAEVSSSASNLESVMSSEPVPSGNGQNQQENHNVQQSSSSADDIDLTYGASQKAEVRVPAPGGGGLSPPPISSAKSTLIPAKPAIIPAKPVDIFPDTELQPSIYMARNSLNTIFVSDLNGSGARAIKTYIVRRSEEPEYTSNPGKLTVAEATVIAPSADQQGSGGVSRSGNVDESVMISSPTAEEVVVVPHQLPSTVSIFQKQEGDDDSPISPAVLLTTTTGVKPERVAEVVKQEAEVKVVESPTPIVVVQSPSSFQTSLSKAEKEAKEAASSS